MKKDIALQVNYENLFNKGNGDLIINKEFKTNDSEINFPFLNI